MSNMGNMGNMGNVGNQGGASGSTVLPDRVDLPFTTEEAQTWSRTGNAWTPAPAGKQVGELPLVPVEAWPQRSWSARWAAWLVVDEFAATDWRASIQLAPWDPDGQAAEVGQLIRAAQDERPDALGEIVAQSGSYEDIMAYFLALLGIAPDSHPKLNQLLHVAGLVGILAAMHFKEHPGTGLSPRPRPSQVCPALLPPLELPGHPSFPSGHATHAMLMAFCMEAALPAHGKNAWRPMLHTLAGRIARNREIAGLHYPSDSRAGFELAGKVFDQLAKGPRFQAVLKAALQEWH